MKYNNIIIKYYEETSNTLGWCRTASCSSLLYFASLFFFVVRVVVVCPFVFFLTDFLVAPCPMPKIREFYLANQSRDIAFFPSAVLSRKKLYHHGCKSV